MKENEGELFIEQWLRFADSAGIGYAQPDAYIVFGNQILLFETKLTQSDAAEAQCVKLYKPLLEKIYNLPVTSVQVFKNIRYASTNFIRELEELILLKGHYQWHRLP